MSVDIWLNIGSIPPDATMISVCLRRRPLHERMLGSEPITAKAPAAKQKARGLLVEPAKGKQKHQTQAETRHRSLPSCLCGSRRRNTCVYMICWAGRYAVRACLLESGINDASVFDWGIPLSYHVPDQRNLGIHVIIKTYFGNCNSQCLLEDDIMVATTLEIADSSYCYCKSAKPCSLV